MSGHNDGNHLKYICFFRFICYDILVDVNIVMRNLDHTINFGGNQDWA